MENAGPRLAPSPEADLSAAAIQRLPQGGKINGPEDDPVAGGDVDQIQVHTGFGDLAGEVGEDAGAILHINHDDLTLASDGLMRDGQGVLGGFGVRDEDVQLGALAVCRCR